MTILKLEDLTKDELLKIMHCYFLEVHQRHINEARRESLDKQANEIMTRAQEKMEANIGGGVDNVKRFIEASKEFDKGMALYDEASKLYRN